MASPNDQPPQAPAPSKRPGNEEPEVTQEESVPSDGKDEKGEEMMEELGRERQKPDQDKP